MGAIPGVAREAHAHAESRSSGNRSWGVRAHCAAHLRLQRERYWVAAAPPGHGRAGGEVVAHRDGRLFEVDWSALSGTANGRGGGSPCSGRRAGVRRRSSFERRRPPGADRSRLNPVPAPEDVLMAMEYPKEPGFRRPPTPPPAVPSS